MILSGLLWQLSWKLNSSPWSPVLTVVEILELFSITHHPFLFIFSTNRDQISLRFNRRQEKIMQITCKLGPTAPGAIRHCPYSEIPVHVNKHENEVWVCRFYVSSLSRFKIFPFILVENAFGMWTSPATKHASNHQRAHWKYSSIGWPDGRSWIDTYKAFLINEVFN